MDARSLWAWILVCSLLPLGGCANWQNGIQWPGTTSDAQNSRPAANSTPIEDYQAAAKGTRGPSEQDGVISWVDQVQNVRQRGTRADDWASGGTEAWGGEMDRTSSDGAHPYRDYTQQSPGGGYQDGGVQGSPYAHSNQDPYAQGQPSGYGERPLGYDRQPQYEPDPRAAAQYDMNYGPLGGARDLEQGSFQTAQDQAMPFNFDAAAPAQPSATPTAAPRRPEVNGIVVREKPNQRMATRTPRATMNGSISVQPGSIEDMIQRIAAESADASFREQFERRVLYALAGQYDEARRPIQLYPREQQELVAGFVDMLIYLREVPDGEMTASESAGRTAIDRVVRSLRQAGGVRIPKFVLCNRVDSFGQYQAIRPLEFQAGHVAEFVAYTEAADWESEQLGDGSWRSEFGLKIEVLDQRGAVVHRQDANGIEDITQTQRRDLFIAPLVRLPSGLSAGSYVVKVTLTDTIGQKLAQQRAEIRLVGRP